MRDFMGASVIVFAIAIYLMSELELIFIAFHYSY